MAKKKKKGKSAPKKKPVKASKKKAVKPAKKPLKIAKKTSATTKKKSPAKRKKSVARKSAKQIAPRKSNKGPAKGFAPEGVRSSSTDNFGLTDGIVEVTYEFTGSGGISVSSIAFGNTRAVLQEDQDPTIDNKYATRDGKVYEAKMQNGQLWIRVAAEGNASDDWTMSVQINGQNISDNPITESVDTSTGKANHNARHS